nr:phage tail tip lysozyme [Streptococcus danieliae]
MRKNPQKKTYFRGLRRWLLWFAVIFIVPTMAFMMFISFAYMASQSGNGCDDTSSPRTSQSTSSKTDSSMASDSDWTHVGSTAYNTAKGVFDAWVSKGLSGAAAAGIVGWVNTEGDFGMIGRAEGHYGTSLEENSIKYGVVPAKMSWYTHEGGGGIYQITPYTKYAPLGSADWEDADKMNEWVGKQVANGDWNASMDMSGKNRTFRQMGEETDPQSATLAWQAYERGSVAHIDPERKKRDAQTAYDLFDGGKYKFDEKLFNEHFGSGGGSDSSSDSDSTGKRDSSTSKIDSDKAIKWFEERRGKVSYAMENRDGPSSYDCSSSIYYALVASGAEDNGYAVSTETEHDWLLTNGYKLVFEGDWSDAGDAKDRQRGDIFIWGTKGSSAGSAGHTGIFKDANTIIHCSFGHNGIEEDNYPSYKKGVSDLGKVYVYRPTGKGAKDKCGAKRRSNGKMSGGHLFDEKYQVIQPYGYTPWSMSRPDMYPNGKHTGIDFNTVNHADFMSRDIPVYAVTDGEVTESAYHAFNGNYLTHTMPDGTLQYYGHLRDLPLKKVGDKVKKGEVIGYLGDTGSAKGTPPHVHFEHKPENTWHQANSDDDPSFLFKKDGTLADGEIIDPQKETNMASDKDLKNKEESEDK